MEIRGESPRVNVVAFGARGKGTFDCATAVTLAKFYRDQSGGVLYFPPGVFKFGSNVTLDGPIELADGAILKPAGGVTLTVSGTFPQTESVMFDISLGGVISFLGTSYGEIHASWFGGQSNPAAVAAAVSAAVEAGLELYAPGGTTHIGYDSTLARITSQYPIDGTVPVLNIRDSISAANGLGVVSDTAAIQSTLNRAHTLGGGVVYAPKGTYLVGDLNWRGGVHIVGAGQSLTKFKKQTGAQFLMSVNAVTGGTTNPADNETDLSIQHITLVGLSVDSVFSEQKHLLNLNAVTRARVHRVSFREFEGDGLYIGSSNARFTERHNVDVSVTECEFDGVNRQNRNGISIIDCDGFRAHGNMFRNIGYTGMPGCIDVEPDAGNAFAVIRNIDIRFNTFRSSPDVAAVALNLQPQSSLTIPQRNIRIAENDIEGCKVAFVHSGMTIPGGATEAHETYAIDFTKNYVRNCTEPFSFDGAKGLRIEDNHFVDCPAHAEVGYDIGVVNRDVTIRRNTFLRCGADTTDAVWLRELDGIDIDDNKFVDCGALPLSAGRALHFVSGYNGTNIRIRRNKFVTTNGRMTHAIIVDAGYTLNNGACLDDDNAFNGLITNYLANGSFVASTPSTGNWIVGNILKQGSVIVGNYAAYICVTAGTPGTWKGAGVITA